MKELLELKEKTECEIKKIERSIDVEETNEYNAALKIRLMDKRDFLKLIEIVYTLTK